MAERTVIRAGGHYFLVRHAGRGGRFSDAIFQIEDSAGRAICHCGTSQHEANQIFDALEHPIGISASAPRRAVASA
jgi:hypothetical protein